MNLHTSTILTQIFTDFSPVKLKVISLPSLILVSVQTTILLFCPSSELYMSPTMTITVEENDVSVSERLYQKGVKHLYENGVTKVPVKYILPNSERPISKKEHPNLDPSSLIELPVIDFAELQGPNRLEVLKSLSNACEQYGFFQVVNHGIPSDLISNMIDVSSRFFELPYEERSKFMSSDLHSPVRYGTSFNQNKDSVFSWRDFLKLVCHSLQDVLPHWPTSPMDLRESMGTYAKETKCLFQNLVEAIVESLGLMEKNKNTEEKYEEEEEQEDDVLKQLKDGSQLMVVNYYPPCPEPDLTLGMPPHSDYGFLTLLLQDEVKGLQIHHQDKWLTVDPLPNSFVVNVGDHLEIFSNGRYKSVLHRVLVNSNRSRISVATIHSLPFQCTVRPSPKLINQANPKRYKDTDFSAFLQYISSRESQSKNFLESRKVVLD